MNKLYSKYISRQKIELDDVLQTAIDGGMFVVIPAYLEIEMLPRTLDSLKVATGNIYEVNVVVVVNCGIEDSEDIHKQSNELYDFCVKYGDEFNSNNFKVLPVAAFHLGPKEKGAGSARKIGMDQVVAYSFLKDIEDSIIVSMDADSIVEVNFFDEVKRYFSEKKNKACSIYFEHPIIGDEYTDGIYEGITLYELHLRYYIQALKAAGFPYAFQTVGSSFATRMNAYVKAGGMTKKQAGEDFYMIHKLVVQGGFNELNSTCVYPSPRPSNRVVFGTGATIAQFIEEDSDEYFTYNPQSFIDLKELFDNKLHLYGINKDEYNKNIVKLPGRIRSFLVESEFWNELENINNNCSSESVFQKRFFELFNAFKIIKYLNFVHDNFLEKIDVTEAAILLLQKNNRNLKNDFLMSSELLEIYRSIDKAGEKLEL